MEASLRYTAPGGHHANGIAERNISTVMSISRAILHHAAIHWPDVADVELWPLAVLHAAHLLNRIPREDTGRSPLELFSCKTWATSKFQDFHVWGCPVYVLGSALSGGRSIPRWKPRLSRGMYVGHSIKFGHSVPLVLDLDTGSITGQFHVVFDDWFQTVPSTSNTKVNFNHNDWYKTFGLTEWQYTPDDDNEDANTATIPVPETTSSGAMHQEYLRAARNHVQPPQPVSLLDDKQRETVQRETVPTPPPTPSSPPPLSSMPLSALNEATAPDASLQREKTHTSDAAETTPPASRQDEVTLTQDSHATSNSVGQHI